jgi:hypothetical protein
LALKEVFGPGVRERARKALAKGGMASFCLDGMEAGPFSDAVLEPTPIAVDSGCMVPETPVLI